ADQAVAGVIRHQTVPTDHPDEVSPPPQLLQILSQRRAHPDRGEARGVHALRFERTHHLRCLLDVTLHALLLLDDRTPPGRRPPHIVSPTRATSALPRAPGPPPPSGRVGHDRPTGRGSARRARPGPRPVPALPRASRRCRSPSRAAPAGRSRSPGVREPSPRPASAV